MKSCSYKEKKLISKQKLNQYYNYLLKAFIKEFNGKSQRFLIEQLDAGSYFSKQDALFLQKIVINAFAGKNPYKQKPPKSKYTYQHPLELIDYIVDEGYTPSGPFVHWVHKKLGVKWSATHWFNAMLREMSPVDVAATKKELKKLNNSQNLPLTLEFYYRMGTGVERINVHPDRGIRKIVDSKVLGSIKYKDFDPVDYLDYYYGGLDREDMTIASTFYDLLIKHRSELPKKSTALIVGNGPVPDEAQTLAMIPEVTRIIPADIDQRNVKIMSEHTGSKNPLATQKVRSGEEHADFAYYLFEQASGVKYGFFSVRETMAVKAINPIYVDVAKRNPLNMSQNKKQFKQLKADLVVIPFCPESITNKISEYRKYISNIANLTSKNKYLCMLALKNANFYISGEKKLSAVSINEKIVCQELNKNGFADIEIITIKTGLNPKKRGFADNMIIWAKKIV